MNWQDRMRAEGCTEDEIAHEAEWRECQRVGHVWAEVEGGTRWEDGRSKHQCARCESYKFLRAIGDGAGQDDARPR